MPIFGKGLCKGESHKQFLNEADIAELINALQDETQKDYLRKRWLHQIHWLNKWAWEARGHYLCLRTSIVVGSALVPFLTTVKFGEYTDWARGSAAIVSLIVAALAGLEALYNWGGIWLEKRRAAELLKVEGWLFLNGVGLYEKREPKDAFRDFVTQVENQIAAELGQYLAASQPPPSARKDDGTVANRGPPWSEPSKIAPS